MAGSLSERMKRKNLEEVNEEFSEFSLLSPARKIRRLDVELPPIMEEEPAVLFADQQQLVSPLEVPVSDSPLNEERALVLYNPVNNLQSLSPRNLSFKVNEDLIPSLKNTCFGHGFTGVTSLASEDNLEGDEDSETVARSLAVVPWVPSWHQHHVAVPAVNQTGDSEVETGCEPMEAETMDASTMELEEDSLPVNGQTTYHAGSVGAGLQQWQQQQHCMTPQPPLHQNTSTPVMWS